MSLVALRSLLGAAGCFAFFVLPAFAESEIQFHDFACKDVVRHQDILTRTTNSSTGPVTHEFHCIERSCFYWGILNPGTDREVQLVEHILIDEKARSFTFSMITWKVGDEAPSYRYSRVKQLLECKSPAPAE